MRTKEQERSTFALDQVKIFATLNAREPDALQIDKKTANFVVGVPTMILANGLGQTLAFLLSKKNDQEKLRTFQVIQRWLLKQRIQGLNADEDKRLSFLTQLAGLDQETYLRAQKEALDMLQWLKRYVRAFQKEDEGEQ